MENSISKTKLTEWVRLYTKELYAWALQKTADRELSEDLVQETFMVAYEKMTSFKGDSQAKTWLFGILKNKIAAHYRKTLRQHVQVDLAAPASSFFNKNGRWTNSTAPATWSDTTQHLLDIPSFNQVFDQCIENLPKTMHACIRLKFLDEKKGQQICEELGVTSANYWQLIRRAKLQLRDCLEHHWFKKEN